MPSLPFVLFSLGTVAVYLVLLRHASKLGPFFVHILLLGALYDYVTEFIGVNVAGTYYYGPFFFRLCTGGGSLDVPSEICTVPNHCIPVAVFMIEAAILLTVIRTTDLLSTPNWVKPFLDAIISVNIDVMLDPIASVSEWCGGGSGPFYGGLGFWTWLSNEQFPGDWFGVPIFNYIAWYADTLAFVIAIRLVIHLYLKHRQDAFSAFKGAMLCVLALILLEGLLNGAHTLILMLGDGATWHFTVAGAIILLNVVIVAITVRQYRFDAVPEWPLLSVPIFLFTFGLGALLWAPSLQDQRGPLLVVWAVTFVITMVYYLAPYSKRWLKPASTGS